MPTKPSSHHLALKWVIQLLLGLQIFLLRFKMVMVLVEVPLLGGYQLYAHSFYAYVPNFYLSLRLMMTRRKRKNQVMLTSNGWFGMSHFENFLNLWRTLLMLAIQSNVEMVSCVTFSHLYVFCLLIMKSSKYSLTCKWVRYYLFLEMCSGFNTRIPRTMPMPCLPCSKQWTTQNYW